VLLVLQFVTRDDKERREEAGGEDERNEERAHGRAASQDAIQHENGAICDPRLAMLAPCSQRLRAGRAKAQNARMRWALAFALVACGGGGDVPDAATDAGAPDVHDAAVIESAPDVAPDVPVDHYLAPLPPYARTPVVDYLGGHLLTAVKVVTVSFATDDQNLIARLTELDDTITQTQWWHDSTAEYCELPNGACIGSGSNGGHVVLNETAPVSLVDTDNGTNSTVVSFIQSHITSGAFPPPDDQTIYVIYFPTGTNISFDQDKSCQTFGAYHYSGTFTLPNSSTQEGSYAIEPRCNYGETFLTQAATHELIEAATDARPGKQQGWVMQDISLEYYGDEVGDLCDHPWGSVYDVMSVQVPDGGAPFNVQRGWSNLSALAGHDPCVIPPATPPYFNTAVASGKEIVYLSVGDTADIELQGFSDGTMSDWTISMEDLGPHVGAGQTLAFTLDKTTMNNGQTAHLTVTLQKQPSEVWVPYWIHNKDGSGHEHIWGASVLLK
jgi:hypothetical protein